MIFLKCDLCKHTDDFQSSTDFTYAFVDGPSKRWVSIASRATGESLQVCPKCFDSATDIILKHEMASFEEIVSKLTKPEMSVVQ